MEDITINPQHFSVLTLVLNAAGAAVKAVPWIPNYYIPFILAGTGAVAHAALAGWSGQNALTGVVAAASAIGLHQGARNVAEAVRSKSQNNTSPTDTNPN